MPDLRVAFVPFFEANPYQPQLARELEALGVEVTTANSAVRLPRRLLRGPERIDVLHLHWLPRAARGWRAGLRVARFLATLRYVKLHGVRIVWTVHNLVSHESESPAAELRMVRGVAAVADRIIVHGATALDELASHCGPACRDRCTVIEHGNYLEAYPNEVGREAARASLGLEGSGPVLLFLGLIRPYKGVDLLLEAFEGLGGAGADGGARLVVAGKPIDAALEEDLRRRLPADGSVTFVPELVPDEDLQRYFGAADAVVFPYRRVLTSGAVVLAMSFGRACVAPRLGCIPDVLDDGGAVLYDPEDPGGLRGALERVTGGGVDLASLGAANLERARVWSWDSVAAATLGVYEAARS